MRRELKATPFYVKAITDREVTGIFSVMGNLDSYTDKIWPGAFAKTFRERAGKVLHLWQHDFCKPPIALIKGLREVPREELPPAVLEMAPDALGGAEVTREYLTTPRAEEVFANLKAGVPLQMSFAYDAIRYDYEELPGAKYEWERIRNLREVRLWETSDVLWGANEATVASKAAFPLDYLLKQLGIHVEELAEDVKRAHKESRRNSSADLMRINAIAELAVELGATNVTLVGDEGDGEGEDDMTEDAGKSSPARSAATTTTTPSTKDGAGTPNAPTDSSSRAAEASSAPTALDYQRGLALRSRQLVLARIREIQGV